MNLLSRLFARLFRRQPDPSVAATIAQTQRLISEIEEQNQETRRAIGAMRARLTSCASRESLGAAR